MKWLKTVIHIHTNYSADSNVAPGDVVAAARRENVDCVAITDHDEIDGALAVRAAAGDDLRVIVGEEVSSADGHLVGLFLRERIPPGLSGAETIKRIREQGGVALAPHPFSRLCDNSLMSAVFDLAELLDGIEIHNAQNPLPWEDWRAARFAQRRGLTAYVGADTHIRGRLAPCFQIMPDFSDAESFLRALPQARFRRGRFGPWYFAQMGLRHVWEHKLRRRRAGFGVNLSAENEARQVASRGSVVRSVRLG